jgi:hypothetical protein
MYTASATGGSALIGGNLNDDSFIDITDFGALISGGFPGVAPANTTCATPAPHADLNGDGDVDLADVTFISVNFLEFSDDPCCSVAAMAPPGMPGGPRIQVSVEELIAEGQGHLIVADLNEDGMLDMFDLVAALNMTLPDPPVTFTGDDGETWFDAGNWSDGLLPDATTSVVVGRTVFADADSAQTANLRVDPEGNLVVLGSLASAQLTIAADGTLVIADGVVEAKTLIVQPGATLRLDGNALVKVGTLIISEGAVIELNGGVIEVSGEAYSPVPLEELGSGPVEGMLQQ